MTTRRGFLAALLAPFVARWMPKVKPTFATHGEKIGTPNRIKSFNAVAWRDNGHTFYSIDYDRDLAFLSGQYWTGEQLAHRCERVINLIEPDGSKRQITINEGL